jgi:hypothetical protein
MDVEWIHVAQVLWNAGIFLMSDHSLLSKGPASRRSTLLGVSSRWLKVFWSYDEMERLEQYSGCFLTLETPSDLGDWLNKDKN